MARLVQEKVRAILQDEGKLVLLDPRRFSNLLKDFLPENKREAFVLWKMLEAGIPQSFQQAAPRIDLAFFQAQFQTVGNQFRFSEDSIANGLADWAFALDLPFPKECSVKSLMDGLPEGAFPPLGNRVAHGLADLVLKYGQTTCFFQTWLDTRLKKTFPLYRGEVFLLTVLLEKKVPQELAAAGKGKPVDLILPRLETRILAEIPFDQAALRWGIESWALSLGLVVPPHSQVFAGSRIRTRPPGTTTAGQTASPTPPPLPPRQEKKAATQPTPEEGPPEKPLLRASFVYLLILTTCALIYNQGEFLKSQMLRARDGSYSASPRERPFLPPDEDEEPPGEEVSSSTPIPQLDGPASFRLAKMYFTGEEGTTNKALARAYFRMAADQGWPKAKAYLAYMLIAGDGGPDDLEGAGLILESLASDSNRLEQAELYGLLRRGAIAGNPLAQKMVEEIKSGNGPFQLADLPIGPASGNPVEPAPLGNPSAAVSLPPASPSAQVASNPSPQGKLLADLATAVRQQDVPGVTTLVKEASSQDLSGVDGQSNSPLHYAVLAKNLEIVGILLQAGANPNVGDRDGLTSLHYAAYANLREIAALLVKFGANVNATGGQGTTPLHQAAFSGWVDMCSLLLQAGADRNLADKKGLGPLHHAVLGKNLEITGMLLKAGADPNIKDREAQTPLHYAAYANLRELAALLLKYGANVNAVGPQKSTPLHQAAFCGWTDMCMLLIQSGANPNLEDAKGYTPLAVAYYQKHLDCHDYLVKLNRPGPGAPPSP